MDYLFDYLAFLAQAATVVVAILVVLSAATSMRMRAAHSDKGHLEVRKLNDSVDALKQDLQSAVLEPSAFKKQRKQAAKSTKKTAKARAKQQAERGLDAAGEDDGAADKRIFVLDFHGDLQATRVKELATEITAVLTVAKATDEVLVRVESTGGLVHGYGLAASQLDRIRAQGVPLVVAVDKVAASGGYLMAAVADRVLAAPFAVMGSIGVVAQIPNVHRLLKKHDVDVEVLTAGKYKRTLTVLGENTDEGRQKFVEELEDVHELFQEFVAARRPQVDMAQVATGETWYGERALAMRLVDEIVTSDDYLARACDSANVYRVRWVEHKKPLDRLVARVESSLGAIFGRTW